MRGEGSERSEGRGGTGAAAVATAISHIAKEKGQMEQYAEAI